MADNFKFVQAQPFSLAGAGCVMGATSITLNSFLQIDGVTPLVMSNFGSKGFFTLEPGNGTREEQGVFTGVVQNANGTATLTGVSNVLFVSPYTETSGTALSHPGGVKLIITNTAGFYDELASKDDDDIINGDWTFTSIAPTIPTQTAIEIHRAASIEYVNAVVVAGAPNATTIGKGIVQLATQAQVDARTSVGSTGASLVATPDLARSTLLSDYKADTGSANAYVITPVPAITAYTTGQAFSFKANNANTTVSTLNVNSLGAKSIVNSKGGVLIANDILAGMLVTVEYDGTSMVMQNPVANAPTIAQTFKFGGTGVDGALSVTSGNTNIDCAGAAIVVKNYTSISITGTGSITFINPNINGTLVILKSQGNVTLTSSAGPMIIHSGMGGQGGGSTTTSTGNVPGLDGSPGFSSVFKTNLGGAASTSAVGTGGAIVTANYGPVFSQFLLKYTTVLVGAGAGSGNANSNAAAGTATSGAGGSGGGGLVIECGGSWNFTTASGISVAGINGGNGTNTGTAFAGGGGGGSGGFFLALYNTLTANTGTVTVSGGIGGNKSAVANTSFGGGGGGFIAAGNNGTSSSVANAKTGGDGATGFSLIAANTEFE